MRLPKRASTAGTAWRDASIDFEPLTLDMEQVEIPITHEMGADLAGAIIERSRWVPLSKRPVLVKVVSEVVTQGARSLRSPAYLATVRRRQARELLAAVSGLEKQGDREDFAVFTHPVVQRLNCLLTTLLDAEEEGNTREILRLLRNTFMNGGWNRYRDPAARRTAREILQYLADTEDVIASKAQEVFHQLYAMGLDPVGVPLFASDEENGDSDGEDQVPG